IAVTGMWNVNRQGKKFLDLMNDAQNRLNQHVRKSTQGQEKTGFLGVRIKVRSEGKESVPIASLYLTSGLAAFLTAFQPMDGLGGKKTCF
ncbi:MAG: hypothetical protein AAGH57_08330, partial [Pseudomonadota bacterium]